MRLPPRLTGLGITLLCGLLYFWGLGETPFYTKGEPREATVVWEIHTSGEWVLPLRNGHLMPSKPPLFHWLGTLTALGRGELNEFTIRFPSAFLATVGVLLTYGAGVALWGVEAGLVAALVLATSFEWARAATTARVDMTLTVFMVMAFFSFLFLYRRHDVRWSASLIFFVLLGLATLAKGPVGAILPGLTVILFLWLQRDLGFLRQLHLITGSVLLLLIAGLWYGLALWKGGEEFFTKQIMQENVLRFFASGAAGAGHEHPFYYFVPNLFLGMLPWSFFFPPLVWFLYQRCRLWGMTESFLYLIVWIATVFIFYSASSSKRSVYILSLYPALALLLGAWWQELRRGGVALPLPFFRLMQVSGAFCLMLLSVAIAGVAAQALGYEPLALVRPFLHPKDQSNLPLFTGIVAAHAVAFLLWCGVAGAAAVMLVGGIQRRYWGWVFAALAAFTVSTALLVNRVFQPEIATARTFRPFMARVVRHVGDNPVFFYRTFDSGALYYADRRIPFYDPALRQAEQSCFLLMWEEEWTKIAQQDGAGLSAVDVSEGTGPKGKRRLVLVSVSADASVPLAEEIPVEDEASEDAL